MDSNFDSELASQEAHRKEAARIIAERTARVLTIFGRYPDGELLLDPENHKREIEEALKSSQRRVVWVPDMKSNSTDEEWVSHALIDGEPSAVSMRMKTGQDVDKGIRVTLRTGGTVSRELPIEEADDFINKLYTDEPVEDSYS